ncbi:anoctamin-7-like [Sycon ciliatum]|uniref:anoctamin-7-like n=1 Tax=Sycon ciliatum TaxID=27933 RepID=UPI0031F6C3CD
MTEPNTMASKEVGFEGLLSAEGNAGQPGVYYQSGQTDAPVESHPMDLARDRAQTTSGSAAHGVDKGDVGVFFRDGVRRIDYVMAFEPGLTDDNKWRQTRAEKRKIFEDALKDTYQVDLEHEEESNDGKTNFVKLHLPFPTLCKWAEILLMRMPLSMDNKQTHTTLERALECCCCGNNPFDCDLEEEPNQYTALFTRTMGPKFINFDKPNIFFSPAQRSRIAYEILSKARYGEGEHHDEESRAHEKTKIGVERLLGNKSYVAAYPLHEGGFEADADINARSELYRTWGDWRHGNWYRFQPLDHIRNYYGEKIAIYFAWLGYYTSVLILPSIVGLIVFIIGLIIAYSGTTNVGAQVCNLEGLNRSSSLCHNSSLLGPNDLQCRDVLMCPLCDSDCDYWLYSSACTYSRATLIFDNPATVFFAAFMALWATFFLEFWKRQQNEIAYDWDLTDFEEEEERPRPRFEAKVRRLRPNPVTQIEEPYQSEPSYYVKIFSALSVMAFFVILVLAVLISVILYRIVVAEAFYKIDTIRSLSGILTTVTASLIQVIMIMLLGKIYEFLAVGLTNWELHRTQTEHEDSFTFKMFLFQFCNYYGSIFYIAFFKGNFAGYPPNYDTIAGYRLDECGAGGCLIELTIQLAIIMVGKQAFNNFMEVVLPRIKVYLAKRDNTDQPPNRWEADYDLNPLPDHGLFSEYLEMVLQYGFVTLFVTAFPLAPIFALINNIVEIRLDANKLLTQTRRPFADRAEDIGIWYGILDALSTFAVITNGLVIALTSGFVPRLVYERTVNNKVSIYNENRTNDNTVAGFALYSISVTSHAVFEELENATMGGPKPLSNSTVRADYLANNRDLNEGNLVCGYRGPKRGRNDGDGVAELTSFYWHSVAGRLAFLIAFEHIVFFIKAIIAWLVPDIPKSIKLQQQREAFLAKTMLRGQDPAANASAVNDDD